MRLPSLVVFALPLLLACPTNAPREQAKTGPSSPAAAPPAVAATPAPAPAEPSSPETPGAARAVAPSAGSSWWCVCYDSGEGSSTTCRLAEAECRALERDLAERKELSHGCRTLVGEHPGDMTGGRSGWEADDDAQAWSYDVGICLLGGRAGHGPDAPTDGDPFAILKSETIGDLRLKMTGAEIEAKLGKPSAIGKLLGPNEGNYAQSWIYADAGMELTMLSESRGGAQTLYAIRVAGDAKTKRKLATGRGVALGSRWADVEGAYADALYFEDGEESGYSEHSSFTAGSVFGWIAFGFEDEVVTSISLAPVAD